METNDLIRGLSSISTDAAAAMLSALFSRLPLGIAFIDPNLAVLAANDAFAKQTGLPLDQLIGRPTVETIPDWTEQFEDRLREVRECQEPWITERIPFEFGSGAERAIACWDSSVFPVLDRTGAFIGHLIMRQEPAEPHGREQESTATAESERADEERARLMEQLRQAQERERLLADLEEANRRTRLEQARWQAVVENMLDPVTVADAQGHATYMNPSYSALVGMTIQKGLSSQEHPGHYRLYHPDGTLFDSEELPLQRAALRNEVVRNIEIVQTASDGSRRIIIWHAAPLHDEEGRVSGSVAVGRDVTEQRQAEAEREQLLGQLKEANRQLLASDLRNQQSATQAEKQLEQMNALLRNLREGVIIVDREGHILLRNDAACEIFGDPDEPVLRVFDSTHAQVLGSNGEPLPPELLPISRVLRGEQLVNEEATVVRADGSSRRVVFGSGAVLDEHGQAEMAILVYRDVTELRNLEQSREEFLSMISHDLRAPITVVQGNAQIIQRMMDRPEMVRQSAESIYTAAHRMNRMIQDLVDSARLESGQLHLERLPLDVASFAVELKQRFSLFMETDRISIEMPEFRSTVLADPDRLERILTNLLSNALKYSDGTVEVKVEEGGDEVKISVIDHGAGIDREELPHLFERFYRAKSSKRKEGLGLGLYITRMLVEAHGGRIWAESEPDRGSTFCFTLPVTG